eukprot:symbB.v1.2.016329.t1/scaffold1222.1/size194531/3
MPSGWWRSNQSESSSIYLHHQGGDRWVELHCPTTLRKLSDLSIVRGTGSQQEEHRGDSQWRSYACWNYHNINGGAHDVFRVSECDLLSLRIDKVTQGPARALDSASQSNLCRASISVCTEIYAVGKPFALQEWDTQYEVAWNWLWDNVAQLLVKTLGASYPWEVAVVRLFTSLAEEPRYQLRASIYDRFFESTPAGQEYFKQSDTRLHFIIEKVFSFSQDIYSDPWQIIDDLSALGL